MFAVGNNLNRAHNYFQDFWKRFSILIKAQQLQLNRKIETIQKKREGSHLGLTCAGPAHLARPSRLALPVVVLLPPEGRGARGRRPWPHAGHLLLLPTPWRRPGMPRDPHVPLSSSLTLPLVSLTLSRDGRARTLPPIVVVATRATPSPLRRAQSLRLVTLDLPVDPRDSNRRRTPSSPSS